MHLYKVVKPAAVFSTTGDRNTRTLIPDEYVLIDRRTHLDRIGYPTYMVICPNGEIGFIYDGQPRWALDMFFKDFYGRFKLLDIDVSNCSGL